MSHNDIRLKGIFLLISLLLSWTSPVEAGNFRVSKDGKLELYILSSHKWVDLDKNFLFSQSDPRAVELQAEYKSLERLVSSSKHFQLKGAQVYLNTAASGSIPFKRSKFLTNGINTQSEQEMSDEFEVISTHGPNFYQDNSFGICMFNAYENDWKVFSPKKASFLDNPNSKRERALQKEFQQFTSASAIGPQLSQLRQAIGMNPSQAACSNSGPSSSTPYQPINPQAFQVGLNTLQKIQQANPNHGGWGFPSDHLPIGGEFKVGNETINVASFNVLNENFVLNPQGQLYKNSGKSNLGGQGLDKTLLGELAEKPQNSDARHAAIFNVIQDTLFQGKAGVLCLQEVSPALLGKLQQAYAGTQFEVTQSGNVGKNYSKDQGVMIYDKSRFHAQQQPSTELTSTGGAASKYLQRLTLTSKQTNQSFEIFNAHVPFSGAQSLQSALSASSSNPKPRLVLGDMNADSQGSNGQPLPQTNLTLDDPQNPQGLGAFSHQNTSGNQVIYDHILSTPGSFKTNPGFTQVLRQRFNNKLY